MRRVIHILVCAVAGLILHSGCTPPPVSGPAPQPPLPAEPLRPPPVSIPAKTAQPVLIIKPTSSVPAATERSYAEKVSNRLQGWIQSMGIPVVQTTDEGFAAGTPHSSRIAVFPYNKTLSSRELAACKRHVAKGGKLVVLFSADPGLAALMGLKLGQATRAPGADSWSGFRFTAAPWSSFFPRIAQNSLSMHPAYPVHSRTNVIAWWESASGVLPREPAWLQSDTGFWMTHILLESDVPAKKQLLAHVLGACDPTLLHAAATTTLNQAGRLGRYASTQDALESIHTLSRLNRNTTLTDPLSDTARELDRSLRQAYERGHYKEVLQRAQALDNAVTAAFASAQPSATPEFRGVWNHSGTGFTPNSWETTCAALAKANMTAVLPHVLRPWCAHYPTPLVPASDVLLRQGDQLKACLDAARRHGLETHAWVILWNLEGAPDPLVASYRKAGRLQQAANGTPNQWLCPSHPANRTLQQALLTDLARRYPAVDGIHLDYTRFKSQDYCYCSGCRTRFEQATRTRVGRWPQEVLTGERKAAYRHWRRDVLSLFVKDLRQALQQLNPRLKLSASVYPIYPGVRESIAQDWGEWLRQGWLDFACPMSYTAGSDTFMEWYRLQTRYPGVKGKVYPGIGVTSMECCLTAVDTISQISRLRQDGATGFTLFEANPTLESDILPYLKLGVTRERR